MLRALPTYIHKLSGRKRVSYALDTLHPAYAYNMLSVG